MAKLELSNRTVFENEVKHSMPHSSKNRDESPSPRNNPWDWGTIIASLIGLVAVIIAGYTAHVEYEQIRAPVWPYLQMVKKVNDQDSDYGLVAKNPGVGPVIVKSLQIQVDGRTVGNWSTLFRSIGFKPSGGMHRSSLNKSVIASGGMVRWLAFDHGKDFHEFVKDWDRHRVSARICYSSSMGTSWRVVISKGASLTPQPVSGCPDLPDSKQFSS
jgi:hypothetical protein